MNSKLSLFSYIITLFGFLMVGCENIYANPRDTLDLSGLWSYQLKKAPASIPAEGILRLPSTLDSEHKSVYIPESDNTNSLRREFSFQGEATYYKSIEIPSNWDGSHIELFMERTRPSVVRVDGKIVGRNSLISSAQRYDLTDYLSPGHHLIEISVDNLDSIPAGIRNNSNECSEATQTNWNGILGKFLLEKSNPFHISGITITPDVEKHGAFISLSFSKKAPDDLVMLSNVEGVTMPPVEIKKGKDNYIYFLTFPESIRLWSNLHPDLAIISFELINSKGQTLDKYSVKTGLHQFKVQGRDFTINDRPVFLRGTVNSAVFPLTAATPMDTESWLEYFTRIKEYGFNHVRFHSWTPPEAAFDAADRAGIYIQAELPIWGEIDRDLTFQERFLKENLEGIITEYSRHPSFILFAVGNELWGDISLMKELADYAKKKNPGLLTTYGSNVYLGMMGRIGDEDFVVASKTGDNTQKAIRGSFSFADDPTGGYFNSEYPNSNQTFSSSVKEITVPVIAHETGQYQSYPDYGQIEKFTGQLKPDNLIEFKRRATDSGCLLRNEDMAKASAQWAAKLYMAEMEMNMRTEGLAGFQLFGIQDYPGQGTALVGILDSFMDPKTGINASKWKQPCSDVAILAEFPKFSFTAGESVEIPLCLINYSENPDTIRTLRWSTEIKTGSLNVAPFSGRQHSGIISFSIPEISAPEQFSLNITSENGSISNNYKFWAYPRKNTEIKKVKLTRSLPEALKMLEHGDRVILMPDYATIEETSIEGLFTTDFWNYGMFNKICKEMGMKSSPGTLGLLIDNSHPSLSGFPTENHTDFQWWPIVSNSRSLIIDRLPKDFNPIVAVIDNPERSLPTALMFECNIGKGKLMVLTVDPDKISVYPEGRWFLQSVKKYMASKDCKPKYTLTSKQLENLLTKPTSRRLLRNYQLSEF